MASIGPQHRILEPRPPSSPPPHDHHFSRPRRIFFYHPAYEYRRLIDLPALDGDVSVGFGIHHATALSVCGIIAGNVWNGWFTRIAGDGPRVTLPAQALLTEQEYWFHVPRPGQIEEEDAFRLTPHKYPVVPSFRHWPFPHNNPPPGWSFALDDISLEEEPELPPSSVSNTSQSVKDRDKNCRLSGWRDRLHAAHLCPSAELTWFREQDMDKYNASSTSAGPYVTDDMANLLALRADIHGAFDDRVFIFTRKCGVWVSHFSDSTFQLGAMYHNRALEISPLVHQAFVFARMAWAIFPRLKNFLLRADRLVYVKTPSSRTSQQKEMGAQELGELLGIVSKGRSKSPQKRQRQEGEEDVQTRGNGTLTRKRSRSTGYSVSRIGHSLSDFEATPGLVEVASEPDEPWPKPMIEEPVSVARDVGEEHRFQALRRRALLKQRGANESLMCCDYNAADRATAAGRPGPAEFGGSHLCSQCRGAEYASDNECEVESGVSGPQYF